jgi:hypothetical protein
MSEDTKIALIISIAPVIVAVTALIVIIRNKKK